MEYKVRLYVSRSSTFCSVPIGTGEWSIASISLTLMGGLSVADPAVPVAVAADALVGATWGG